MKDRKDKSLHTMEFQHLQDSIAAFWTMADGGKWMPWPFPTDPMTSRMGIQKRVNGSWCQLFMYGRNKLWVHSLVYKDGRRWDCFNGWTHGKGGVAR